MSGNDWTTAISKETVKWQQLAELAHQSDAVIEESDRKHLQAR